MSDPIRSFWSGRWRPRVAGPHESCFVRSSVIDDQAVKDSGGARQRLEPRWVATTEDAGNDVPYSWMPSGRPRYRPKMFPKSVREIPGSLRRFLSRVFAGWLQRDLIPCYRLE